MIWAWFIIDCVCVSVWCLFPEIARWLSWHLFSTYKICIHCIFTWHISPIGPEADFVTNIIKGNLKSSKIHLIRCRGSKSANLLSTPFIFCSTYTSHHVKLINLFPITEFWYFVSFYETLYNVHKDNHTIQPNSPLIFIYRLRFRRLIYVLFPWFIFISLSFFKVKLLTW